jgi:hypothetical protein
LEVGSFKELFGVLKGLGGLDRQTESNCKGTIAIAQIERVVFAARSQARYFDLDRQTKSGLILNPPQD